MSERFKVVLDHARRYTSVRLYLYLLTVGSFVLCLFSACDGHENIH